MAVNEQLTGKIMEDWWWNALSAVGTLAAVVVALWFSVQSVRSNGRAEKDRSEMAAAKMLSPLSALESKVSYLFAWFFLEDEEFDGQYTYVFLRVQELEAAARAISIEDLYPLLHLNNHAAKRSARALGLIQTFAADAIGTLTHHSWGNVKQYEPYHKKWAEMLSEIQDHLAVAVLTCKAAASTGAPRPTAEEIHGP
ncbi:hypothetical protein [Pseudomonas sp. Xaverov 83]|uniref:hypothetical protein n=1 Tax=Pseudomonas sp. Xaverov 83 TaxID=2666087 RepID=UPI001C5AC37E|nr:hypothetical protein [Pseudomonas sp. Xaverov 83]